MVLSETFWIAFVSTMSASCLVTVRWCYRSKCTRVNLCGMSIERDVEGEEDLDRRITVNESSNKMDGNVKMSQISQISL